MKRGLTATIVAVGMLLGALPLTAWADCCAVSASGCQGKALGTSCGTGGNVCVFIANKCPKPKDNPGDLCECSKPDSSLTVKPDSLGFSLNLSSKTSTARSINLLNSGGIPLDVGISQTSGEDAFSVNSTTTTVPPKGKIKVPVTYQPPQAGSFSGGIDIVSDAAKGPPTASVDLTGTAKGSFRTLLSKPIKITSQAAGVEMSYNPASGVLGAVFYNPIGSSQADILYSTSTNGGKAWSPPFPLVSDGNENLTPLIVAAPSGQFIILFTDQTGSQTTKVLKWKPGQPAPTPTLIGPGFPESVVAGGGNFYLGMFSASHAQFRTSSDGGLTWTPYSDVPVDPSDFTCDANIAFGSDGTIYAFWEDYGLTSEKRFESFSSDHGVSFSPPILWHSFADPVDGIYFDPTMFLFGTTLTDFGNNLNTSSNTFSAFVDYEWVAAASPAPLTQPIGGAGIQARSGIVINNTYLAAVAIDTANGNALDLFTGPLGGSVTKTPITSVSDVREARIFPTIASQFVISVVQGGDPGTLSVIRGQVK